MAEPGGIKEKIAFVGRIIGGKRDDLRDAIASGMEKVKDVAQAGLDTEDTHITMPHIGKRSEDDEI